MRTNPRMGRGATHSRELYSVEVDIFLILILDNPHPLDE